MMNDFIRFEYLILAGCVELLQFVEVRFNPCRPVTALLQQFCGVTIRHLVQVGESSEERFSLVFENQIAAQFTTDVFPDDVRLLCECLEFFAAVPQFRSCLATEFVVRFSQWWGKMQPLFMYE